MISCTDGASVFGLLRMTSTSLTLVLAAIFSALGTPGSGVDVTILITDAFTPALSFASAVCVAAIGITSPILVCWNTIKMPNSLSRRFVSAEDWGGAIHVLVKITGIPNA